jgi:hypothetical protein
MGLQVVFGGLRSLIFVERPTYNPTRTQPYLRGRNVSISRLGNNNHNLP